MAQKPLALKDFMDFNEAKRIMELNRRFYDLLADDFSRREDDFKSLAGYFQDDDKVLDLGCGNGRFYNLINHPGRTGQYFGIDNSSRLIAAAKERYPPGQFVVTDGLSLPFTADFFDKVFCPTVFYHLPGYEMRREFLREVWRVLKPGGFLILCVRVSPYKKYWRLLLKYAWLKISGRSKLDWGDVYEPWGGQGVRYFHHFSRRELRNILEEVDFKIESFNLLVGQNDYSNLIVAAKK